MQSGLLRADAAIVFLLVAVLGHPSLLLQAPGAFAFDSRTRLAVALPVLRALAHPVVALAIAPLVLGALAQLGNPMAGKRPCRLDLASRCLAMLDLPAFDLSRLDPARLDLPMRGHRASALHLSAYRRCGAPRACGVGPRCGADVSLLPVLLLMFLLLRLVFLHRLDLPVVVMLARLARLGGCTEPGRQQRTERGGQKGTLVQGTIAEGGGHGELLECWQARPLAVRAVHVKAD